MTSRQRTIARKCLEEWIEPPNTSNLPEQPSGLWRNYQAEKRQKEDRAAKVPKREGIHGLRWVTLGYHYDWQRRQYTSYFHPFPWELSQLCADLAHAANDSWDLDAQAAIVNIYHQGSSMGGHQDDAELSKDHPIVSISLGCPCVFLIGGLSKEEVPLPIALRSGDVVLFGGSSRLRHHGVPKIWREVEGNLSLEDDISVTLTGRMDE